MCPTAETASVDSQAKCYHLVITVKTRGRRCNTDWFIRHIFRWSVQAQNFNFKKEPHLVQIK